jgi:hypothetical protein
MAAKFKPAHPERELFDPDSPVRAPNGAHWRGALGALLNPQGELSIDQEHRLRELLSS